MLAEILKKILASLADGGRLLILTAIAALIFVNCGGAEIYDYVLHFKIGFDLAGLHLNNSISHWINDGLMVLFFLLVGLELKREIVLGELSNKSQIILPSVAALGGMLVPALIFIALNQNSPELLHGWAIPAATDIAFSLAILALLRDRVSAGLKVFLTTVAVVDDLGAIIVIAFFYTATLEYYFVAAACGCLLALIILNRLKITKLLPYLLIGILLWLFTLQSGIHATIAGVLLAFTIPISESENSPLQRLEGRIHGWVSYFVLPIFGFANAGVPLTSIGYHDLTSSLVLAIIFGLFIGKQIGVFLSSWLVIKFGWASLPSGTSFRQLHSISILAGIGFTMSLFVGSLAFSDEHHLILVRLGVLLGSGISAILGYISLRLATPN